MARDISKEARELVKECDDSFELYEIPCDDEDMAAWTKRSAYIIVEMQEAEYRDIDSLREDIIERFVYAFQPCTFVRRRRGKSDELPKRGYVVEMNDQGYTLEFSVYNVSDHRKMLARAAKRRAEAAA